MQESVSRENLIIDIAAKVSKIRSYTPKVGIFGSSGVGKSSLCNALFGKDVAKISDVEACTRKPQEILICSENERGGIVLVDVPGIGEDPSHQIEYTNLYKSLVPELDLVLWAIKADDRNYASALDCYKDVFDNEHEVPPVLFVITQTDKTNDTEDWDQKEYKPGGTQILNILTKEKDVSNRFNVSAGKIISIAVSKKGRTFNLKELVEAIVEALPNEKKYSLTREAKEENVSVKAIQLAEKGIFDSIKELAGNAWDHVKEEVVDIIVAAAPELVNKAVKAAGEALRVWLKKLF